VLSLLQQKREFFICFLIMQTHMSREHYLASQALGAPGGETTGSRSASSGEALHARQRLITHAELAALSLGFLNPEAFGRFLHSKSPMQGTMFGENTRILVTASISRSQWQRQQFTSLNVIMMVNT
jgi:hypothetical protein